MSFSEPDLALVPYIRMYRCALGPEKTVCKRVFGCSSGAKGIEYHPEPVLYIPISGMIPNFLDPTIVTAAVLRHQTIEIHTYDR